MSGVAQINIVIPSGSPPGNVPLSLLVDGIFSPPGVTIAVKQKKAALRAAAG